MNAAPAAESSSQLLDVPFVPQTKALCGGAALSMVVRYWGATDVYAEDWATLVQGEGIPAEELVKAAEGRGFVAHAFSATSEDVDRHIENGRPLIALVEVAPGRRHYVVVVGRSGSSIVFHDPAAGPWRVWPKKRFMSSWRATKRWALLVLPAKGHSTAQPAYPSTDAVPDPRKATGRCEALVDSAIEEARAGEVGSAEEQLEQARGLCPESARPLRELAGLRFRAGLYRDAAHMAREAARLEPGDPFTWRLLGTSQFLGGHPAEALDAWNHVGEPRLGDVHLTGLIRTRVQHLYEHLALAPRQLLAAGTLERTERRVRDLPSISAARTAIEPAPGGVASLRIALVERPLIAEPASLVGHLVADALVDRSSRLTLTSPTGRGERLDVGVCWWTGRPSASLQIAEPGGLGLPGIVGAGASWDQQTFGAGSSWSRETRVGGGLSVGDWWLPSLHGALAVGIERWEGRRSAVPLGVDVDHRLLADRIALRASGTTWLTSPLDRGFSSAGVLVAARTSSSPARIEASLTMGLTAVTSEAPLSVWPGAGEGHVRPYLLRAYPLLSDDSITGPAFGRGLAHLSAEVGVRALSLGPSSFGTATFLDLAQPWSQPNSTAWGPGLASFGCGVRLRLPGFAGALRADVAWSGSRGKPVFSLAWREGWPGLPAAIR